MQKQAEKGSWKGELSDIARALSGAFLFGMPLLFTMEMWWIGSFTDGAKLLVILLLSIGVNVMLAYFEGFKRESSFGDAVEQAIESVAIGAVAAAGILVVLNQIEIGDPLGSILGKTIVLGMPLSLGAAIANSVFRKNSNGGDDTESGDGGGGKDNTEASGGGLRATLVDVGTTIGGGLFVGFAIAPTAEVPMLAAEMDVWHEVALIVVSLLLSYMVVFQSGIKSVKGGVEPSGPFQHPLTETVLAYVVSLVVAFGTLVIFSQLSLGDPIGEILSLTVILGLPTALGGAAGRLLI
jgi:putative integral membrane protein (TIGR02587 family)